MKRLMMISLLVLLALPLAAIQAQGNDNPPPPPASYAEVAADYTALEKNTVAEGEQVVEQFIRGDFSTIYDRLSAEMQAQVGQADLERVQKQVLDSAPIGDRIQYRVMLNKDGRIYIAQHQWGQSEIVLLMSFDSDDKVNGLNVQPVPPLPADPAAGYRSAVTFRLPADGLLFTFWGGDDVLHNYHVDAAPQRHAYDFVVWKNGSTYSGDGTAPEDYYIYGQPVLAPAGGTVVAVMDGLPNMKPKTETDSEHPAGNHVVIQVAEKEYLFLAHMQPGSIVVKVGDTVKAGQVIGKVGNSGNTSEPHIHIHLQDQPEMFVYDSSGKITGFTTAVGLPIYFSNLLVNGLPVASGEPLGGQFVQNAP